MEVDAPQDVAATSGKITVLLHPLVVLNISEHWTRNKVKTNSTDVVVYGVLLGKQEGHHVEVLNSFELLLDGPNMSANVEYFTARESQCKQVYPHLDVIGWYTTGGPLNEKDELFNGQMQEMNESLIILKLDPLQACGEQLPVRVYESVIDNDARVNFRQVTYTLATDEAERIGVDHVARITASNTGKSTSMTAEHLLSNYQAIQMLASRLHLLRAYVNSVAQGELPFNQARLRDINALTKRLPLLAAVGGNSLAPTPSSSTAPSNEMSDQLYRQANDVCLSGLLSSMTQGLHVLHNYLVKTAQVIEAGGYTRGGMLVGSFPSTSGFQKMSRLLGNTV